MLFHEESGGRDERKTLDRNGGPYHSLHKRPNESIVSSSVSICGKSVTPVVSLEKHKSALSSDMNFLGDG